MRQGLGEKYTGPEEGFRAGGLFLPSLCQCLSSGTHYRRQTDVQSFQVHPLSMQRGPRCSEAALPFQIHTAPGTGVREA